jgi:hypothetical protein
MRSSAVVLGLFFSTTIGSLSMDSLSGWFITSIHAKTEPKLDVAYRSTIDLDLVVSIQKRNAALVAALLKHCQLLPRVLEGSTGVLVYYTDKRADINTLRQGLRPTEVIRPPNVDRERET